MTHVKWGMVEDIGGFAMYAVGDAQCTHLLSGFMGDLRGGSAVYAVGDPLSL